MVRGQWSMVSGQWSVTKIRHPHIRHQTSKTMIRNYFTIALRHLTRHKLFSLINIVCLAIGITFTMLIGFYVFNERNVNAHISHVQNQYIIRSKWKIKSMGLEVNTLGPLAKALKEI